jgi:hypothetical protein
MRSYTKTSLRIFSTDLNPDEITRQLGIEPAFKYKLGDIHGPTIRKNGMWILASILNEEEKLEDHLIHLLNLVEPHQSYLFELSKHAKIDFFCGVFNHLNIFLTPQTMSRIAALGGTLDVSVYPPFEDDEE